MNSILLNMGMSRQLPWRYEDGLVMETTGSREGLITSEHLKISIYFSILDAMLSELDCRFVEKNLENMWCIHDMSRLVVLILLIFLGQTVYVL